MKSRISVHEVTDKLLEELEDQAVRAALEEIVSSQDESLKRVQQVMAELMELKAATSAAHTDAIEALKEAKSLSSAFMSTEHALVETVAAMGHTLNKTTAAVDDLAKDEARERAEDRKEDASLKASIGTLGNELKQLLAMESREQEPAKPTEVKMGPMEVTLPPLPPLDIIRAPDGRIRSIVPRSGKANTTDVATYRALPEPAKQAAYELDAASLRDEISKMREELTTIVAMERSEQMSAPKPNVVLPVLDVVRSPEGRIKSIVPRNK